MKPEYIRDLARQTAQGCIVPKSVIMLHKREKKNFKFSVPQLSLEGFIHKRIKTDTVTVEEKAECWAKEAYPIDGWVLKEYFLVERNRMKPYKIEYFARYFFVLTSKGELKVLHVVESDIDCPSSFKSETSWENIEFCIPSMKRSFSNSVYYLDWGDQVAEEEFKDWIAYWNFTCLPNSERNTGNGLVKKLQDLAAEKQKVMERQNQINNKTKAANVVKTGRKIAPGSGIDTVYSTYWYQKLLKEPKAQAKVALYKRIVEQLIYFYRNPDTLKSSNIGDKTVGTALYLPVIRFAEDGLVREEACHVWASVLLDFPLAFFVHANYKTIGSEGLALIMDKESNDGKVRMQQVKEIEDFVTKVGNAILQSADTPEQAAIEVYRYLVEHGTYDTEMGTTNYVEVPSHSIYGYVKRKKAVCEGFAKTYQAILLYLGIECVCINGILKPGDGKHAWNKVFIDKKRFVVDATLGNVNQKTEQAYNYFGEEKYFAQSHKVDYTRAYFAGCGLDVSGL